MTRDDRHPDSRLEGPERDAEGYHTGMAGHLWKDTRGPDSVCARPGCGLYYSHWGGDRCFYAPNCPARYRGEPCVQEEGHKGDHHVVIFWADDD